MSFNVILQTNKSEPERVSKETTTIMTATGVLKSETSLIDPVILVECNLDNVINCNYISVSKFNRKYFVRNIRSIRHGLVEFTCHVDVLSSFATEIKKNTAILKKQEQDWNLYLNDGSFKIYQNPMVLTKSFPSGFSTQEFVLAVAGS